MLNLLSERCSLIVITTDAKSFTETILNERITHRKIICSRSAIRSYWCRLFGPLLVKLNKKTSANQVVEKRYGSIFTRLSSRAIHIELTGDLSTDSFILALCRYISRRGYPRPIMSDNGTNFVDAQQELSEALRKLDNSRIKDDLNQIYIIWKFNPPSAP